MKNIVMIIAYDGGGYIGWQDNGQGNSVEGVLRQAIEQIVRHPVVLQAASRTDAGVHAEGQVVNFLTSRMDLDLPVLQEGIQALIPKDIAVLSLSEAAPEFHPTLDNKGKEYHYFVTFAHVQMPLRRHWEWHYPYPPDVSLMRQAAAMLTGTHNFHAFCNTRKNLNYSDFVRTLHRIEIVELGDQRLRIELEGSSFLFRMARNIVGTLLYIGCGRLPLDILPTLLESGDRTQAGMTAFAHGLTLKRVIF